VVWIAPALASFVKCSTGAKSDTGAAVALLLAGVATATAMLGQVLQVVRG